MLEKLQLTGIVNNNIKPPILLNSLPHHALKFLIASDIDLDSYGLAASFCDLSRDGIDRAFGTIGIRWEVCDFPSVLHGWLRQWIAV